MLPLATFSKKKCKENWLSMPQVLAATFLALICTMQPNSFLETNPDSENTFDLGHYKGSRAQWLLLFPVDRDTHKFFCRLQSNVFDAASLFQTNDMLNWNAPREDIFFCVASWLFHITRCSFTCLSSRGKLTALFIVSNASKKSLRICPDDILSSADKQQSCWQFYGRQKPR